MKTNILKLTAFLLLLAGSISSCEKEEKHESIKYMATGTIIGSYSNGWLQVFIQVDEQYPIGKTFEYIDTPGDCMYWYGGTGIYQNTIAVQPLEVLEEFEGTAINKRISFSYREFQREEDQDLFLFGHGNSYCVEPLLPVYVITEFQFIK